MLLPYQRTRLAGTIFNVFGFTRRVTKSIGSNKLERYLCVPIQSELSQAPLTASLAQSTLGFL